MKEFEKWVRKAENAKTNPAFNDLLELGLELSDFSVAIRYPDQFDDLSIEDAKNAYSNAIRVKNFVLQNFFN